MRQRGHQRGEDVFQVWRCEVLRQGMSNGRLESCTRGNASSGVWETARRGRSGVGEHPSIMFTTKPETEEETRALLRRLNMKDATIADSS
jgi:hypothetical protein